VRLLRLILSLIAVCAAIAWGLRGRQAWQGSVTDASGAGLSGATVILVRAGIPAGQVTTDIGGLFTIPMGSRGDTSQNLVACKAGFEATRQRPRPETRDGKRPPTQVILLPARADYAEPYVASLLPVLPIECR
jgi:hypothetical protein